MSDRYLFLDLQHITRMDRLYRRLHQPQRCEQNPILRGEHSWESMASLYGTVLFDPEEARFKMWYLTGPARDSMVQVRERQALGNITLLGYAISTDGIHWEKPILDQVDFEGSTANNLIDIGRTNCEGAAVLYDTHAADPLQRFKAFYWEHGGIDTFVEHKGRTIWGEGERDGMWMSFSPDGVSWTNVASNPVIALGSDTTQSLLWDPKLGKYVVFGRFGAGGRKVARAVSEDAIHFSEPELVLACDDTDEEGTQIYGMPVCLYEGIYLGMIWIYREGVDGTIDTSLTMSRDGIHWQRVLDRQTFLSLGEPGSWEDGMARISQQFCTVVDQVHLYYGGVNGPHTGRKFDKVERQHPSMLGLATLRRDGFVSVDAADDQGTLLTKPLEIDGGSLHLNVNAAAGSVVVTITDDRGEPITGYTSVPISCDAVDTPVSFDQPLESLQGRQLRLQFQMTRASLYSYWVGDQL